MDKVTRIIAQLLRVRSEVQSLHLRIPVVWLHCVASGSRPPTIHTAGCIVVTLARHHAGIHW